MITFKEAVDIINSVKVLPKTESIDFRQSAGRVLAENIYSDIHMPPFDKSAVDGYACRKADLHKPLRVLEIIAAGKMPKHGIKQGCCSKIMTGAMVPHGADTIIMVEDVTEFGDGMIGYNKKDSKTNICFLGEDIKNGDLVIKAPELIKPQHIAIMATVGHTQVRVYKKPRIAVIPTGNEIVEPEFTPNETQIRNSNGVQMMSQVQELGISPSYEGIAADTEESTMEKIQNAISDNDIVLLSGGVSMGDFDVVPEIVQRFGFEILFHKVSVQPGKPTLFAQKGDKFLFGLPGNPVSSFMQFKFMVKPLIYRTMGLNFTEKALILPLGQDYSRKSGRRMSWIPVKINELGQVEPMEYHGSAHLNALGEADGVMAIPANTKTLTKGTPINVRLL